MGSIAIACYKPKEGKESDLDDLVRIHFPTLCDESLVKEGTHSLMRSANGTIIEVFEWLSREAKDLAHTSPSVTALWERFAEVSDSVPLSSLDEAPVVNANFTPLDQV
jgi:hypothetical protein